MIVSDPDIKWFTICQVADMLQVSEDYVRSLARTGRIKAIKLPGGKNAPVRINEESVSKLLASCQIEPSSPTLDHLVQNLPKKSSNLRQRSASAASWGV
jgi:excisionase family DNA binding protein